MNDPVVSVKNILASEICFAVRPYGKEKYPVIIYAKEYRTDDAYRIKAEMTLEQIKSYYDIFKRIIEQAERKGDINE